MAEIEQKIVSLTERLSKKTRYRIYVMFSGATVLRMTQLDHINIDEIYKTVARLRQKKENVGNIQEIRILFKGG